jgi:flagellar hook-associated protein 2
MDINGIVSQLIKAEGQPQYNAIANQEKTTQTRLSGLGSLKSALSTFQSAVQKLKDGSLFKTAQATSDNESVLKVTAGVGAVTGTHTVKVNQLAKAQQSIAAAEYANSSAAVASGAGGTLDFSFPTGSTKTAFSVTIDASNNTLTGIRDAINSAADNGGVTASIINVDSTVTPGTTISKLVLTAKDSGVSNGFSLAVTGGDAGLDVLDTQTSSNYSTVSAADAIVEVDGQTATRSSNSITDVIQGVTLDLKSLQSSTDSAVNVSVSLDTAAITKTITDFVTGYNNFHSATNSLGKYAGSSGESGGQLMGNSTLRNITGQLRQETTGTVSSASSNYNSLAMIGISISKDGVMSLDSSKLNAALSASISSVSDVFSSSGGVATRLDAKLTQYLESGGPLDTQQTSLGKQLKTLGTKRDAVQLRLDNLQKALQKQFIAMDTAVGQLKTTATFLTQKFG